MDAFADIAVLDATRDSHAYAEFKRFLPYVNVFNPRKFEYPENPDKLIISGSRSSVYSGEEWIEELLAG